jgi:copper oxidase (laccase) domain-containing protein
MILKVDLSAQKHGICDADIEHAVKHALKIDNQEEDLRLYLGPARNASLLEVVTTIYSDHMEVAIHAMAMRPKYRKLLSGE